MDRTRHLGLAVGGGVILTLLTGLFPLRTLMGATHYGFPMPWLIRLVLAPEYFPWRVGWLGLIIDLIVWTTLVFVILFLYDRFSPRSTGGQPT